MKRIQANAAVALTVGSFFLTCAHQEEKRRVPEVVATQPPPSPAVCQTPFAIVPASPAQTECRLAGPDATAWTAVPVPGADGDRANPPRRFGSATEAFCVYEWRDSSSHPNADAFTRIGGTPDCPMVAMMAPASKSPELPKFVWEPLVKVFEKQARGLSPVDWKRLHAKYIAKPKIPVRVEVVDGKDRKRGKADGSVHGFAVRRVISSLLCDDPNSPDCQKRVQPNIAAPSANATSDDCPDGSDGADFVTFHKLYDALAGAIARFQPKREHLVINLSIGWDSVKTDENDQKILAIERLLQQASCMGAIVVAAAGNVTGTEGPLYPAAYEVRRAPGAKQCADLKLPPPKAGDSYSPLVHAVGAVDAMDQRMEIVRRWGQPRLSAYGMSVTAPGPKEMPYSPPLSGTSMSAAIVSGIAAAVWSARSELDASQVMALVYDGGVVLDGGEVSKRARTEFCVDQPFGPCREWAVHRAVLCGALARALPGERLACSAKPVEAAELPQLPKGTVPSDPANAPPPCRVTGCGKTVGPATVQIPVGAVPQPGVAGCPGCTLTKNYANVNWDLLWGYPTSIPPSMYATIVRTYNTNWQAQDFWVANPTTPGVFYYQWMHIPQNTYTAGLYWYYSLGGFSVWDLTPLIVN